ncbi:hypothetical protein BN2476_1250003 [Paraburkholderia piptadeniae]|uniref:Uncharacterized protein n=3 Tax=Paraburkholderia TaxID=1822464 RepID=A0A7X1NKC1_9BURK|nr:hypothetical protein [Paraburkholderia piptadeniae]MPW23256.1 hypothetical protein [Paraburkholderia franconis]SIT51604.1 hypothetical protein BN2476_1250003 [Paraburkholderia piptadeniae]
MSVLFYAGRGLTKLDEVTLHACAGGADLPDEDLDFDEEDFIQVVGNPRAPQLADGVEVNATYRCAETMFFGFPHWTVCRDWVG